MTLEQRAYEIANAGYNTEKSAGVDALKELVLANLRAVVQAERERCAEAAFQWEPVGSVKDDLSGYGDPDVIGDIVTHSIAAAIREGQP